MSVTFIVHGSGGLSSGNGGYLYADSIVKYEIKIKIIIVFYSDGDFLWRLFRNPPLHPGGHCQRRRPYPHCYSVIACERSQRLSDDEPEVPWTSGEGGWARRGRSPTGFVRGFLEGRARDVTKVSRRTAGGIQRVETCKLKRFGNTNVQRNLKRDANTRTSRAYGIRRDKLPESKRKKQSKKMYYIEK